MDCEPSTALTPDQAPEAEHDVALAEDQVRVELVPLATVLGLARRLTLGAGDLTETVTDCVALPAGPAQVNVYVELAVSAAVACDPLAAFRPDHAPEAKHSLASVLDQLSVESPPDSTVLGVARSVTTGAKPETVTITD